MAKRLAGVTVLEGGSIKWATVAGIFLGVPTYALTHGLARTIDLVYAAFEWAVLGPYSFATNLLNVGFADATRGIDAANRSFMTAVSDAGVLAPLFAAGGTALTAYIIYRGVTALYG